MKKDQYDFEITLKMGPPEPTIKCWHCERNVAWVRWQQQLRGLSLAYDFFKRPTCEWCQSMAFSTRKMHFDDGTHYKRAAFKSRKAHNHLIEWQLWAIYLSMILSTLKTEIRIQSRCT